MLFLTGGQTEFTHTLFSLQTTLWMVVVTGALGAGITSYQFFQYLKGAIRSCVIDKKELSKNNYTIWREQCADWSFVPVFSILLSLVMLVFANGQHGMMWLVLYVSLSPVVAAALRAIILSFMGTPAHRTII